MPALLERSVRKKMARPATTRSAAVLSPQTASSQERDHLLVINDASWGMYLDLDSKFEDTNTRVSYFNRRIDIITLSTDHERIKGNLSHLIAAHCFDEDIEFVSTGAATLRLDFSQGKEPDDSIVFGIESKSRPDMVLEVVLTSGAIDKLAFYAPLRIPEVWVWDGAGLGVHLLDGSRYRKAKKSRLLPKFDIALAGKLATATRTSQAVREFRQKKR